MDLWTGQKDGCVVMTHQPLVSLVNVGFYRQGQGILQDISLDIHPAELTTLIGPNGSGKSTLLRLLLGLLKPCQGHVSLKKDIRIGYVPQKFQLNPSVPLTLKAFFNNALGDWRILKSQEFQDAAQRLGLFSFMHHPFQTLSGGEVQKALFMRALALKPHLLILDEPTQGLDVQAEKHFYDLIDQWRQRYDCSVFMVSHNLHFVHGKSDRVICLNRHICCSGKPQEVILQPSYRSLYGGVLENIAFYPHSESHDHSHE